MAFVLKAAGADGAVVPEEVDRLGAAVEEAVRAADCFCSACKSCPVINDCIVIVFVFVVLLLVVWYYFFSICKREREIPI